MLYFPHWFLDQELNYQEQLSVHQMLHCCSELNEPELNIGTAKEEEEEIDLDGPDEDDDDDIDLEVDPFAHNNNVTFDVLKTALGFNSWSRNQWGK